MNKNCPGLCSGCKLDDSRVKEETQQNLICLHSQKSAVSIKVVKKKQRRKAIATSKLGGSEFTPVCNQKSLKFHFDDLQKDAKE